MTQGFVFIDYDGSYPQLLSAKESRSQSLEIVGQEYDKVAVVIGPEFYYNEEGKLSAGADDEKSSPLRELLFQAVSRAREELTLIVTGDPAVFARINSLKLIR